MSDKKYRKLRGRIIEKYGTYREFSDAMGWKAPSTISRKLASALDWHPIDRKLAMFLLDIKEEEADEFFRP